MLESVRLKEDLVYYHPDSNISLTMSTGIGDIPLLESPDKVEGIDEPGVIWEVVTVWQRQGLLINSSDTKESNNRVYYGPGPHHVVGGHTGTTGALPADLRLVGLLRP